MNGGLFKISKYLARRRSHIFYHKIDNRNRVSRHTSNILHCWCEYTLEKCWKWKILSTNIRTFMPLCLEAYERNLCTQVYHIFELLNFWIFEFLNFEFWILRFWILSFWIFGFLKFWNIEFWIFEFWFSKFLKKFPNFEKLF